MKAKELQRHLLTGVSYFIPFVVAGGILIAMGFLFGGIYVYESDNLAAQIFQIGQDAFGVMIGVLAAYIAYSIADRPGLAPGFIGGIISTRLGAGFIGGILIGLIAGYIVNFIKKIKLPKAIKSLLPVLIIPVFGTLIVGIIMVYVIAPPAAWLTTTFTSLLTNLSTGSKIILAIVIGAMMAFDMGGPVGKVAYAFGLAALDSSNLEIMATVMVGGMIPPLAIALAMLAARNKFNDDEWGSLSGCFIGSACFITEFAIPYAANDPFRVIPSIMFGSAVGCVACILFNVSLAAPHGGLFVIFLADKPLLWILSIIIGAVAGAAMLVLLKPNLEKKAAKA
jgi:PTS system fructose-specific IIC component